MTTASQTSKTYRFEHFEFYAERGMVTLIDTKAAADSTADPDDAIKRIAPGQFMMRAISALVADPKLYPSHVAALRKLVQDAKEVCLAAKKQGDPTDPSVLEHVVRHQRKRSIVLPGEMPALMGPQKLRPKGKDGAAGILRDGVEVVPDFSVSLSALPPLGDPTKASRRPRNDSQGSFQSRIS